MQMMYMSHLQILNINSPTCLQLSGYGEATEAFSHYLLYYSTQPPIPRRGVMYVEHRYTIVSSPGRPRYAKGVVDMFVNPKSSIDRISHQV